MAQEAIFLETQAKDKIRSTIGKQFDAWLSTRKAGVFNTLAGDKWIVERSIAEAASKQSKTVIINNFEHKRKKHQVEWSCPWAFYPSWLKLGKTAFPSSIKLNNRVGKN